ncbi:hypothetical protein [Archaeoglobus profundus]|uniref:hypothetical protein n=1 Tax=Archaeoglobus profundus TaxID=84156 RepID=UPI00064E246D|nr:hypothetical protein [Archaeoglobus profundus]
MKIVVDVEKWRSIDYERELEREIERIKKSKISETNKKFILKYKNHRLANGVSVARVCREVKSLRLLCERYNLNLDNLNEDVIEDLFAELELSKQSLNTINEYKKALKYFLRFRGNEELARKIKRREPKDNDLTRDDLLSVDEVLKLVSVTMNERDSALIMCHLDLCCRPEEVLTLTVGDFVRDAWGRNIKL